jgi:hypothetical protein
MKQAASIILYSHHCENLKFNMCVYNFSFYFTWIFYLLYFSSFHFSISSRPALGSTQPPIKWVPGLFPGVKWQGREADHSPPTSAEVKKMWIYTSTLLYIFMA